MNMQNLTNEQLALYIASTTSNDTSTVTIIEKAEKYYEWLENKREQLKKKQ